VARSLGGGWGGIRGASVDIGGEDPGIDVDVGDDPEVSVDAGVGVAITGGPFVVGVDPAGRGVSPLATLSSVAFFVR
jgi:hypothetical protein